MPDSPEKRPDHRIRRPTSTRDAVSAVKMSEKLTAEVDAWAEAHGMARSDAIRQLIELGLSSKPTDVPLAAAPGQPVEFEDLAVKQISQLLDPSLPTAERERRIRRLIEGPPEFSAERKDLPKPKK
ncbi:MAG: ribbon-helix-helix domain-containing protein [Bradyrhizobium sp.]